MYFIQIKSRSRNFNVSKNDSCAFIEKYFKILFLHDFVEDQRPRYRLME
jgi:hypothetical protein